ncbi:MAG: protein of unknown function cysteine-rich region domain protein, partial [Mycobacterium sp.]|nr:protein of unknown function cysteine-rich region domain protein [Mycobacterium sp.]
MLRNIENKGNPWGMANNGRSEWFSDLSFEVRQASPGTRLDPDVLWSCTTCGACVEQCPVDIEHVDHIIEMRRYHVLIESEFPSEAGVMMRNLENNGNPWGVNPKSRNEWT